MKHEGFCETPSCVRARLAAKMARLNAASGTDVLAADALRQENETLRALLTRATGTFQFLREVDAALKAAP
jgi:hypothetical protein